MAITFGSNIGSATSGAFAIFPVNDSVGGAAFNILDANVVTGAVVSVTGGVPLTSLQTGALSAILAKLISGVPAGTVTGNELEFLQKLVGVLSLKTGATVTLSAVNTVGNVWRLSAVLSVAGEALVYVPNSAAEGLFTGEGAGAGSSAAPSGPAGGVLGYPGSTYPNPNGLASPTGNRIPIKPRTGGGSLTVNPDSAAEATDMVYRGGNAAVGRGGHLTAQAGDTTDPASDGGSYFVDAGTGGTGNGRIDLGVTNADSVRIGRTGKTVSVFGRNQSIPEATVVAAADVVTPGRSLVWMTSAGAVSLNGTTPVADLGAGAFGIEGGDVVTLVNMTANQITVPAGGNVLLSSGAACVLDQYGTLTLLWLGRQTAGVIQKWVELSRVTTPT
jgi:hypothetical protein